METITQLNKKEIELYYNALVELKKEVSNKTLKINTFIKKHKLPTRFKDCVLKVGLILSVGSKKKEGYFWIGGRPTKADAKYIRYFINYKDK
jgi:hypothetical protein